MNGGLFVRPRDLVKPVPFVNIYYHHGERNLPAGWVNGGAGGFRLNARDSIELAFESGELELDAFPRTFGAELMISPFRPTEPQKQWHTRYYHGDAYAVDQKLWVQEAMKNGCTHIIEHHASDSYPFINYPMYTPEMNRPLIEEAHAAGIGVKFYYTVRELTSRLPEFWALRSLRDEILPRPLYDQGGVPGQGGTDPDLIEIGGKELIPAWKHIFDRGLYKGMTDPAIITNATSRLCNFHVEGLKWMLKNLKIDGIYIDDVGYKREVMRRVRRTLDQYRPGALIDMHTWNHFEDKLGAGYGHNMLIYMELMPYLDSLLIGEAYDYDHVSPEYFMTEISGLPFGLMGETLQNGGNQWRGMLYGMDCRYPWCSGVHSPVPLWQLWDAFDMDRSEMIGYWEDGQPVYADQEDVKCTVYVHREHGRLLCCFANFSGRETTFTPVGSGLEGKALRLPGIGEMQGERPLQAGEPLTVTANGGVILWAE